MRIVLHVEKPYLLFLDVQQHISFIHILYIVGYSLCNHLYEPFYDSCFNQNFALLLVSIAYQETPLLISGCSAERSSYLTI